MANRSYLYATDRLPDGRADSSWIGLSEWNYDIPLVYKLLLSGSPQVCLSTIWPDIGNIAIASPYALGLQQLERFLSQIHCDDARPLIQEAVAFLTAQRNRRGYFVLECGEIFAMENLDTVAQCDELVGNLCNLEQEVSEALNLLNQSCVKPASLLSKLFPRRSLSMDNQTKQRQLDELGLGNWSNTLYYDISELSGVL